MTHRLWHLAVPLLYGSYSLALEEPTFVGVGLMHYALYGFAEKRAAERRALRSV